MQLFEPHSYPNVLKYINTTAEELYQQIATLPYRNDQFRNEEAEGKLPIESVPPFYRFILNNQRVPTQEEYFKEFFHDLIVSGCDIDSYSDDYIHGLKARISSRTYPSLLRDVYFSKLLYEKLPTLGMEVIYNPILDIQGIDILICDEKNKRKYAVCLFLDTEQAKYQLRRKRKSRPNYYGLSYVEFPIKTRYQVNGIWLYDNKEVANLLVLLQHPDKYIINI